MTTQEASDYLRSLGLQVEEYAPNQWVVEWSSGNRAFMVGRSLVSMAEYAKLIKGVPLDDQTS